MIGKKETPILQKISVIIILLQILLVFILHTISFAGSSISIDTKVGTITVKYPERKLKVGDEATIDIYIGESNLVCFDAMLKYDKNVFQIENFEKSVETIEGWNVVQANELETGTELMLYPDSNENVASNTLLASIHFKVINVEEGSSDIFLNDIFLSDKDDNDNVDEEGYTVSQKFTLSLEKSDEVIPPLSPSRELYLSSKIYKIGNNDINNYEKGDQYISRIEEETNKEDFINNLDTNGNIRIIKQDGTELEETEFVGTGMTLEVTKDDEIIELKVAVIGDLDGDGRITATDLSTLNQTILKIVTLDEEYKIAGDLDESESITATDLSTLNKMVLEIQ